MLCTLPVPKPLLTPLLPPTAISLLEVTFPKVLVSIIEEYTRFEIETCPETRNSLELFEITLSLNRIPIQKQVWYPLGKGGLKSQYDFRDSVDNYEYFSWYPEGQLETHGFGKDGYFHGIWETYDLEGRLVKVESLVEGILEGSVILYHPNGKMASRTQYCGGWKCGLQEEWDPEGNLVSIIKHRKGPYDSEVIFPVMKD